jgi:Mut7-C RNAse domain
MAEARFRFYAELNDFLAPERRFIEFPYPWFVLDTHLGKLAAYLRLMGFDTLLRAGVLEGRALPKDAGTGGRLY